MARTANPKTRPKLIEAGTALALEKGFADLTVDEVCRVAGLTKGAFFHYFRTKESLGMALLASWLGNGDAAFADAPFWSIPDPLDRLHAYVDFVIETTESGPPGCLVGIFSQELWQSHPEIRAGCEAAFTAWAEGLADLISQAKDLHVPRHQVDSLSLAYHFVAIFEGGMVLARAFKRQELAVQRLRHFKDYLNLLFDPARRQP